jgi:hypothetical protein
MKKNFSDFLAGMWNTEGKYLTQKLLLLSLVDLPALRS